MKKLLIIAVFVVWATVGLELASAASSGLTLIGSGKRSAHGSMTNAHALYLRGYGHHLHASYSSECVGPRWNGGINHHTYKLPQLLRPGRLYRVSAGGNPYAPITLSLGDCTITATLRGTGRLRLQILAQ